MDVLNLTRCRLSTRGPLVITSEINSMTNTTMRELMLVRMKGEGFTKGLLPAMRAS